MELEREAVQILTEIISPHSDYLLGKLRAQLQDYKNGVLSEEEYLKNQRDEILRLENLARYDALTNLPNARSFYETLPRYVRAVQKAHDENIPLSICILAVDANDLHGINEKYHHIGGNKYILEHAIALKKGLDLAEGAYRIGGDEFVRFCIASESDALKTATTIQNSIQVGVRRALANSSLENPTSIGITSITATDTPETAWKRADKALYMAKKFRDGTVVFFTPDMD